MGARSTGQEVLSINHYETLRLTRSATREDIEAAFIKAAEWQDEHSDGKMSAAANARRIQRAYDVLIDPESRQQYERDTFRRKSSKPYRLPDQRPPRSNLWWIMVIMIAFPAAWLLWMAVWRVCELVCLLYQ